MMNEPTQKEKMYLIKESELKVVIHSLELYLPQTAKSLKDLVRSNPQENYEMGFEEGFAIGKAQCETPHEELKEQSRNATLDATYDRIYNLPYSEFNMPGIKKAIESLRSSTPSRRSTSNE